MKYWVMNEFVGKDGQWKWGYGARPADSAVGQKSGKDASGWFHPEPLVSERSFCLTIGGLQRSGDRNGWRKGLGAKTVKPMTLGCVKGRKSMVGLKQHCSNSPRDFYSEDGMMESKRFMVLVSTSFCECSTTVKHLTRAPLPVSPLIQLL